MLIKKMLLPTIKKKIVLFLAMIFVIVIGSFVTSGFSSYYTSFKSNTHKYIEEYGYPDITLNVNGDFDDTLQDIQIDGVEKITPRLIINAGILNGSTPTIVKMTSIADESFLKYYVVDEKEASTECLNIYVDFVYAKNNGIEAGKKIYLYNSLDSEDRITVYVQKLVGSPETIYPMIQYGYQADKYNFGYAFAKEADIKKISKYSSEKYKEIVVKTKAGADLKTIDSELKSKLLEKGININYSVLKDEAIPITYINTVLNYIYTASVVVPIIFAGIIILLVFLFLHQICKSMTREMGVLNSLGVSKKSIFMLLFCFSGLVSAIGGIVGSVSGFGLSIIMYNICKQSFSMPFGTASFSIAITLVVIVLVIFVSLLASLFTIFTIRKLSPKDAMNNDMNNNKHLPNKLDNLTKKSLSFNLAINSMHKNKTRFLISFFAVVFGFTCAYGALAYEQSINYYTNEISERIKYKAQIYVLDQDKKTQVKDILDSQLGDNVQEYEEQYLSNTHIIFNNKEIDTNICAIKKDSSLVYIPGNIKLEEDSIVLESKYASELGVKVNDYITIKYNETSTKVKVSNISNICTEKYNFMTLDTYKKIYTSDYGYCTYLVNYSIRTKLVLPLLELDALPLYTDEYLKTYRSGTDLTLLTAKICVGIGLSISFIAMCIMAQSALLEQKRKFCTLSTLGLSRNKIFRISISEMVVYLVLGLIPGIPLGLLLNFVLTKISSTDMMTLFFINPAWVFFAAIGIIAASIILNLVIEWFTMKRWNVALETKARE